MENNYQELIDRFLRNQMPEEEMQDFKHQIDTNIELKQQVRDHVLLIHAIRETQAEKDKQIIDSVHIHNHKKPIAAYRPNRSITRYLAIAASFALLVVVGHDLFYSYSANQLAGELSSQTIAQYQSMTMRGVEDEDVASLDALFHNVEQGKDLDGTIEKLFALYAISKDEFVDAIDDYNIQIGMELAIAYIRSSHYGAAENILVEIVRNNPNDRVSVDLLKYCKSVILKKG